MSLNTQGQIIPTWTKADRFRKAREMRGLTQAEIAEQIGLSRRTVISLETGHKEPALRDYNLWQLVTGVPREWLETGEITGGNGGPRNGTRARSGVRARALPGLDSNQEPIGLRRVA